jgi:hypothetical protein
MPLLGKAPRDAVVVRALAFGDPDGSLWAAGLDAGAPGLIAGGSSGSLAVAVAWDDDGREWRLSGEGVTLTVSPMGEPKDSAEASGDAGADGSGDGVAQAPTDRGPQLPWSGRQDRCRVTGTLAGAEVDAGGVRTELDGVGAAEIGSIRGFSGWLDGGEALTLLALRSESEPDHERDLVAATVFDPDRWIPSIDPRLSTTYDHDGDPSRATLELWIADGDRELPRRAAGEATGPAVRLAADGTTLQIRPLRCHSRGNEGAGVYLLASH